MLERFGKTRLSDVVHHGRPRSLQTHQRRPWSPKRGHGPAKASEVLRQDRRPTDVVCRYGGEEFSVLLPHTDVENACIVAERIRAAIEATDFDGLKVTSSIGVSAISFGAQNPNDLLDQADKCLYVAKRGGRNQVVRYDKAADEIAAFIASGQKDVGRDEPKRIQRRTLDSLPGRFGSDLRSRVSRPRHSALTRDECPISAPRLDARCFR